jgi:hypothetical protein
MMDLMASLEYVRAYINDLLIITRGTLDDHIEKNEIVLARLRDAGLKVNAAKSFFCTHEIEYLGYILTREGIKPQNKKSTGDTRAQSTQQRERATALSRHGTILP